MATKGSYSKAKDGDEYETELSPALRAVVKRLRAFVKKEAPQLREQMKWGGICFVGNGVVCYAHALEDRVDFGFFQGVSLKDPKKVLEGKGKYLRFVKVAKPSDIREKELAALIKQALALDA